MRLFSALGPLSRLCTGFQFTLPFSTIDLAWRFGSLRATGFSPDPGSRLDFTDEVMATAFPVLVLLAFISTDAAPD
jgi:hypothetical protein